MSFSGLNISTVAVILISLDVKFKPPLNSAPSIVMVWEADGIIDMARKIMGATFGYQAEPGTIRGDFSCSKGYNLIHGSDSQESAQKEISLFFKLEEIIDYEFVDAAWLYGRND